MSTSVSAQQDLPPPQSAQQSAQYALDNGDFGTALVIYRRHALAGEAWAQIILGQINQTGRFVTPSVASAVDWYVRAAATGSPEAQYRLGLIFCDEQNRDLARPQQCLDWLQRAVRNNHPAAKYKLALMAYEGKYINGSFDEVRKLAVEAADGRHGPAFELIKLITADQAAFEQKVTVLDRKIIGEKYDFKKYTIRIAIFDSQYQLLRFVVQSPLERLYAYQEGNAWVMSHGYFKSQKAAQTKLSLMPENINGLSPRIQNWSQVHASLQAVSQ